MDHDGPRPVEVLFAAQAAGHRHATVVPFLLTCPDSMVVVDFKGENVALTANARKFPFGTEPCN